ncbi:MAG: hypothetical protein Q7T76_17810 [Ferruginibacter sp.]|nr:hypothetical protein [Ferruginibacter sp.]
MRLEYLHLAIIVFSFIALILVVSMLLIMLRKRAITRARKSIANQLEPWIMDIILENAPLDSENFPVPANISLLLERKLARKVLLRELVKVKRSLSGVSGENLEKLFSQLELQEISLHRTTSKRWHVKSKGIQELGTMNHQASYERILELTNNEDLMVRMEAQTAMVRLRGYKGLEFFNTLTYPLSEWHQVNILHLLAHQPVSEQVGILDWLNSTNPSVVQFALKLIAEQHAGEFYQQVLACLDSPYEIVRKEAILCLGQVPSMTTIAELTAHFNKEDNKNLRLCIIKEFAGNGSEEDIAFLKTLQQVEDVDIKLAASKSLLQLQ